MSSGGPNEELAAILEALAKSYGGPAIDDAEIVDRCILALVNEGAGVLADRVTASAGDIDVVFRNGYGFPSSRGGPMFHADAVGLDRVVRRMRGFAASDRFFEPHPLLVDRARAGTRISDSGGA